MKTANRVIYLRDMPGGKNAWLHHPYYWKVTEISKEKCTRIFVTKDSIEFGEEEDFFEEVSFIKTTLCKNKTGSQGGCEEISREEFDAFYIKTINKLNEYMMNSEVITLEENIQADLTKTI